MILQAFAALVLTVWVAKAVNAPQQQGQAHVYSAADTRAKIFDAIVVAALCGRIFEWW